MDDTCARYKDYMAEEAAKRDRIQRMTIGNACVIFQSIDTPDISEEEKAAAIFKVIRWLLELSFDIQEGEPC